jgi:hydroxyethylthiazole kinase-like uncharacterized protein yjeF
MVKPEKSKRARSSSSAQPSRKTRANSSSSAPIGRRPLRLDDHKYTRGVVAVAAGSQRYPGAATLAVGGARRGGAGYVNFLSKSNSLIQQIIHQYPDVVPIRDLHDPRIDAVVVGPGGITLKKLPVTARVVLDGAAMKLVLDSKSNLGTVSGTRQMNQLIVLTPHEGELREIGFSKPSTKIERLSIAQKIADQLSVIVVLKGKQTIIAAPNLKIIIDSKGGPELATAGTGDVLAGLIGAFLASWRPENLKEAQNVVAAAVQLHSKAGSYAAKKYSSVVATDILESLAYC